MRNSIVFVGVLFLAGCAAAKTQDPKSFSRQVCLDEEPQDAGWQELPENPENASELLGRTYKRSESDDSDSTEIWYGAPGRLLRCSTSGASLCGHFTSKFKLVDGQWVEDGGVLVMCHERR
jgi:hypothetical protein